MKETPCAWWGRVVGCVECVNHETIRLKCVLYTDLYHIQTVITETELKRTKLIVRPFIFTRHCGHLVNVFISAILSAIMLVTDDWMLWSS